MMKSSPDRQLKGTRSTGRVARKAFVCLIVVALLAGLFPNGTSAEPGRQADDRVTLTSGTVLKLRLLNYIGTQSAAKGDEFRAMVTDDLKGTGDQVLLPRGCEIVGRILKSKRAGRIAGRASIRVKFDTLRLPTGETVQLETELQTVKNNDCVVNGEENTIEAVPGRGKDAAAVGVGAGTGGAIGGIKGGRKGAIIGTAAGAAIGLAGILGRRGRDVELPTGTEMTIKLIRDVSYPTAFLR